MADYLTTDTELTSIANAIRTKGGTSASLSFPTGFVDAIAAIPTGGGLTTVSFSDQAVFTSDSVIVYLDENGEFQTTTQLAMMEAVSYQFPSGSLIFCVNNMDPMMGGAIYNLPSTLTLKMNTRYGSSRLYYYVTVFQVD